MDEPYIIKIADFLREVGEPPPHLVEGLLPNRALILLAARPKHAKTFLALDIAEAVASGNQVCDRFSVNTPGPVVYLMLEDGRWEASGRARKRGITEQHTDLNIYLRTEPVDLSSPETVEDMARQIAYVRPVLIIIDTAAEALDIRSWNNRTEILNKFRPLRKFAHKNCTVLLLTHNNKAKAEDGNEIAGTNAITAACDGWLSIYDKEPQDNGNLRLWVRRRGRNNMKGEMVLEMDTDTLRFRVVDVSAEDRARAEQARVQKLVERMQRYLPIARAILSAGGLASVTQISEMCSLGYKTTQVLVREMRECGMLCDSGEREGAKHNVILYELTAEMEIWTRAQPSDDKAANYEEAARLFRFWGEEGETQEEEEDD